MNRKNFRAIAFSFAMAMTIMACNDGGKGGDAAAPGGSTAPATETQGTDPKGIGKFKDVQLGPIDEKLVASGKTVYDVKCQSCHKLTDEKVVGPGWAGVTTRRTPEWIMNFVTNVDEMIEKDTAVQRMLEECLVRMPNQNLSDDEARNVLEFMRKNDAK